MGVPPRWYHCTFHTYGAWLPGDPRGYRTRDHREHVDGDYKNPPPPGAGAERLARSRGLLAQAPVRIPAELRPVAGAAILDKLIEIGARLLALSVGATHVHLQAQMPPGPTPRLWIGRVKVESNFALKRRGWTGKLWAMKCKVIPVADRGHQENTFHYIRAHVREGAWVWTFRDGA